LVGRSKEQIKDIDIVITASVSFAESKHSNRTVYTDFLSILAVIIYASFTMHSGMVWVDALNSGLDYTEYNHVAVVYWVQYEFLIFIINILAIPIYMLVMQLTQHFYGKDGRVGGPRFFIQTKDNNKAEDILMRHTTFMNQFQMYFINLAMGIFLITIKYEMSEEQKAYELYFVGRKINKFLILGISVVQILFSLFFMCWSNEPELGKKSLLAYIRQNLEKVRNNHWRKIATENNEIFAQKETTNKLAEFSSEKIKLLEKKGSVWLKMRAGEFLLENTR
jgi:hypothetical protein